MISFWENGKLIKTSPEPESVPEPAHEPSVDERIAILEDVTDEIVLFMAELIGG